MGAQTSKVARKLPTKARPETLKNVPKESPSSLSSTIPAFAGITYTREKKQHFFLKKIIRIKNRIN